jgi:methylthioribose-1-phosphate isomerase
MFGGELLNDNDTVLTHCNAGALATGGVWGTALGVIRGAVDAGKHIAVIADETRALPAGCKAYGLGTYAGRHTCNTYHRQHDRPCYEEGTRAAVVVGSDRIAANGDVANKIGTLHGGRFWQSGTTFLSMSRHRFRPSI